jgi:hypothetical protein
MKQMKLSFNYNRFYKFMSSKHYSNLDTAENRSLAGNSSNPLQPTQAHHHNIPHRKGTIANWETSKPERPLPC